MTARAPLSGQGLVLLDHCAHTGDNLVDQSSISVRMSTRAWYAVWAPSATIAPIPRQSTDSAPPSTATPVRLTASDLHRWRFSTTSTAPKTTSLRQGLVMTQDVRAANSTCPATCSGGGR